MYSTGMTKKEVGSMALVGLILVIGSIGWMWGVAIAALTLGGLALAAAYVSVD